jgi:tripartite-type tricarboxylate transporter receptor subunit TctC
LHCHFHATLRNWFAAFCIAGCLIPPAHFAHAQPAAYPARPLRLIVPFPPGGGTDIVARLVARHMTEGLGQQVIVDNRGGAGGMIGIETAIRAAPDGYTIAIVSSSYAVNPALYKLSFDPVRDISAINLVATGPSVVAVHPGMPVQTLQQLIDYARTNPGKLNYGSGGLGSHTHLITELFKLMAKLDITHVPYKGSAPSIADLLAGQTQLTFAAMVSIRPHVQSGKLRGLAVTSARRSQIMPELPTVAEAGVPGYEASTWYGVVGPPHLPAPLLTTLNREITRVAGVAAVRALLANEGFEASPAAPEAYADRIRGDIDKWQRVVREANVIVK